eukprot:GAHX01000002.1.p1 GENE.GAHX01000002.1~~GAHX01000002.1.p1  ORF type:complete len:289 (-),score=53.47 GAHX01000002.1:45-911(-)
MPEKSFIVACNWKANISPFASVGLFTETYFSDMGIYGPGKNAVKYIVAPTNVHLGGAGWLYEENQKNLTEEQKASVKKQLFLASQDVSPFGEGAHTGDMPASILKGLSGFKYTLIGHSERRHGKYHVEKSEELVDKLQQSVSNGLSPIFCIGETLGERESGSTESVLAGQLSDIKTYLTKLKAEGNALKEEIELIVAYEPVWAIGTGHVPSNADIYKTVTFVKSKIHELVSGVENDNVKLGTVLYGGSVNVNNCVSIKKIDGVDGFLIGGASLKANTMKDIINLTREL